MQDYSVHFAVDNALFQLHYLFDSLFLLFHINKIHLVNAPTE